MSITPSYDDLAYGDLTFHDTHPGLLAAVAATVGHWTPPVNTARILELGCGTGFNILAMSQSLPEASFVGIDLSAPQIARANSVAREIGARNVTFHCASIDSWEAELHSFDFIIAHGIYSWVPSPIRIAILRQVDRLLSPQGVAYISYNTLPGWRLCQLVRDALRQAMDPTLPFIAQIPKARAHMEQLLAAMAEPEAPYAAVLRTIWQTVSATPDYYIAHEYLAEENTAVFFDQFAQAAAQHNLQFLIEARLYANSAYQSDEIAAALATAAGDDLLRREQHLDFLTGRFFRQSILCRALPAPQHDADPALLLDLNVSSSAEILDRGDYILRVRQIWGKEVEVTDDACIAALLALEPFGVRPVPIRDIEPAILGALGMEGMRGLADPVTASVLLAGWRNGLWTLRADSPAMTHLVSDHPAACPLARLQASLGAEPTSRLHRPVRLTPEELELLRHLDGTQTGAPAAALLRFAAAGLLAG
ncbi:MAG TPA: class I SAM-dependent methyltransferase [Bryobacteraceae bacterium]|nr:class I SAM-dependent methyltransferase [Bryobacteraceae bacterium]